MKKTFTSFEKADNLIKHLHYIYKEKNKLSLNQLREEVALYEGFQSRDNFKDGFKNDCNHEKNEYLKSLTNVLMCADNYFENKYKKVKDVKFLYLKFHFRNGSLYVSCYQKYNNTNINLDDIDGIVDTDIFKIVEKYRENNGHTREGVSLYYNKFKNTVERDIYNSFKPYEDISKQYSSYLIALEETYETNQCVLIIRKNLFD